MKKRNLLILGLMLLFSIVFYQNPAQAQDTPPKPPAPAPAPEAPAPPKAPDAPQAPAPELSEKEVIIEKVVIDKDGNKTTTKVIKKGNKVMHMDVLKGDHQDAKNVRINVEHIDGKVVIKKDVDGVITEKVLDIENMKDLKEMHQNKMMFIHDGEGEMHDIHGDVIKWHSDGHDMDMDVDVDVEQKDGYMIIRKRINGEETEDIIELKEGMEMGELKEKMLYFHGNSDAPHTYSFARASYDDGIACDRPFLGVMISDEGKGLLVKDVFETSGAEAAGIEMGDRLLTIDGVDLENIPALSKRLSELEDGAEVTLTVDRNGETITTKATLQDRENNDIWEGKYRKYWIAIKDKVDASVEKERAFMGIYLSDSEEGVHISGTVEESGAKAAGIQSDDLLVSIEGNEIAIASDVTKSLAQFEPGETVNVRVLRDGQPVSAEVTLTGKKMERINWKGCDDTFSDEEVEVTHKVIIIHGEEEPIEEEIEEVIEEPTPELAAEAKETALFEEANNFTLQLDEVQIYPNPTRNFVNVAFRAENEPIMISIIDASGRQVYNRSIKRFKGYFAEQIDLSEAVPGTSVLTVRQGDKFYSEQIIRQ